MRPALRTLDSGHRHASWLELFYDLVIVVAVAQLAHGFMHHPGTMEALKIAGLFSVVYLGWQGFSFYADRFDTDDPLFRVASLAQMLAFVTLAALIPGVGLESDAQFALSFAVLRGILVLLYLRVYLHLSEARPLVQRYGSVYAISVGLWIASAFVPTPWNYAIWGLAVLLDLSMPWLTMNLHTKIPTHPAHVPERLGLFTIIVLGELIVAVGVGTADTSWSTATLAVAACTFVTGSALWWLYFDHLGERELERRPLAIVIYAYAHLPLLCGLVFIAAGAGTLIDAAEASSSSTAGAWALCGGIVAVALSLVVAHAQLKGLPFRLVRWARFTAAAALIAIPLAGLGPVVTASAAMVVSLSLLGYEAHACRNQSVDTQ